MKIQVERNIKLENEKDLIYNFINMEIWKDIPWYEWKYQVSNIWNVKSLKRNIILHWNNDKDWYKHVTLCKNWVRKTKKIHRLVMDSFIWECKDKPIINHKNWIKSDNVIDNLERCTVSYNTKHAYDIWLKKIKKGKEHHLYWKKWKRCKNSKKVMQYDLQWNIIKLWDSMTDIQRELWIRQQSISRVCLWKMQTTWWFIFKFN